MACLAWQRRTPGVSAEGVSCFQHWRAPWMLKLLFPMLVSYWLSSGSTNCFFPPIWSHDWEWALIGSSGLHQAQGCTHIYCRGFGLSLLHLNRWFYLFIQLSVARTVNSHEMRHSDTLEEDLLTFWDTRKELIKFSSTGLKFEHWCPPSISYYHHHFCNYQSEDND